MAKGKGRNSAVCTDIMADDIVKTSDALTGIDLGSSDDNKGTERELQINMESASGNEAKSSSSQARRVNSSENMLNLNSIGEASLLRVELTEGLETFTDPQKLTASTNNPVKPDRKLEPTECLHKGTWNTGTFRLNSGNILPSKQEFDTFDKEVNETLSLEFIDTTDQKVHLTDSDGLINMKTEFLTDVNANDKQKAFSNRGNVVPNSLHEKYCDASMEQEKDLRMNRFHENEQNSLEANQDKINSIGKKLNNTISEPLSEDTKTVSPGSNDCSSTENKDTSDRINDSLPLYPDSVGCLKMTDERNMTSTQKRDRKPNCNQSEKETFSGPFSKGPENVSSSEVVEPFKQEFATDNATSQPDFISSDFIGPFRRSADFICSDKEDNAKTGLEVDKKPRREDAYNNQQFCYEVTNSQQKLTSNSRSITKTNMGLRYMTGHKVQTNTSSVPTASASSSDRYDKILPLSVELTKRLKLLEAQQKITCDDQRVKDESRPYSEQSSFVGSESEKHSENVWPLKQEYVRKLNKETSQNDLEALNKFKDTYRRAGTTADMTKEPTNDGLCIRPKDSADNRRQSYRAATTFDPSAGGHSSQFATPFSDSRNEQEHISQRRNTGWNKSDEAVERHQSFSTHSFTSGHSFHPSRSGTSHIAAGQRENRRSENDSFVTGLSEGPVCRICQEGDEQEVLVSPCYCAGTMGLLHISCLQKWLGCSNKTSCEICKFEFLIERRPMPISLFVRDPGTARDRRNLICDIVCVAIITPLTVATAYMCINGAMKYYREEQWERRGLFSLAAILMSIYILWFVVMLKHNIDMWRDWKMFHQEVTLLATPRVHQSSRTLPVYQTPDKENLMRVRSRSTVGSTRSRSTGKSSTGGIQLQSIRISVCGPMVRHGFKEEATSTPIRPNSSQQQTKALPGLPPFYKSPSSMGSTRQSSLSPGSSNCPSAAQSKHLQTKSKCNLPNSMYDSRQLSRQHTREYEAERNVIYEEDTRYNSQHPYGKDRREPTRQQQGSIQQPREYEINRPAMIENNPMYISQHLNDRKEVIFQQKYSKHPRGYESERLTQQFYDRSKRELNQKPHSDYDPHWSSHEDYENYQQKLSMKDKQEYEIKQQKQEMYIRPNEKCIQNRDATPQKLLKQNSFDADYDQRKNETAQSSYGAEARSSKELYYQTKSGTVHGRSETPEICQQKRYENSPVRPQNIDQSMSMDGKPDKLDKQHENSKSKDKSTNEGNIDYKRPFTDSDIFSRGNSPARPKHLNKTRDKRPSTPDKKGCSNSSSTSSDTYVTSLSSQEDLG